MRPMQSGQVGSTGRASRIAQSTHRPRRGQQWRTREQRVFVSAFALSFAFAFTFAFALALLLLPRLSFFPQLRPSFTLGWRIGNICRQALPAIRRYHRGRRRRSSRATGRRLRRCVGIACWTSGRGKDLTKRGGRRRIDILAHGPKTCQPKRLELMHAVCGDGWPSGALVCAAPLGAIPTVSLVETCSTDFGVL